MQVVRRQPHGVLPLISTKKDLLAAHVEALFTLTPAGRLDRINEPLGGPAPRFFLGRTLEDARSWYRTDVSWDTIRQLESLLVHTPDAMDTAGPPEYLQALVATLASAGPVATVWAGPAYLATGARRRQAAQVTPKNVHLLKPFLTAWQEDIQRSQPLWMVVQGGHAVSICGSVRCGSRAHEAGVETVPEYRGRGYGGRAVAAWAAAVQRLGKAPLYSPSWTNESSRRLARRLGFTQIASDVHIT